MNHNLVTCAVLCTMLLTACAPAVAPINTPPPVPSATFEPTPTITPHPTDPPTSTPIPTETPTPTLTATATASPRTVQIPYEALKLIPGKNVSIDNKDGITTIKNDNPTNIYLQNDSTIKVPSNFSLHLQMNQTVNNEKIPAMRLVFGSLVRTTPVQ